MEALSAGNLPRISVDPAEAGPELGEVDSYLCSQRYPRDKHTLTPP